MILTVNLGNTHITIGGYEHDDLKFCGRLHTDPAATVDEYGLRLLNLLSLHGASPEQIEGGILGSVVPALTGRVLAALQMLCPVRILTVGPGLKSGIRLRLDNPAQLGAELLCGAVAALAEGSGPLVVISADTAISLMAVNEKQELVGGVILPGPQLSLAALVQNTAQLPQIDLSAPAPTSVLGKNTAACLQNGFVLGTAGMLDGLADHFCAELGPETKFYATGNLPTAIRDACRRLGSWRLHRCTMYVTLEPCPMCAGAIVQARIPRVVIGCMNPKAGCAGSVLDMLHEDGFNHQAEVETGVLGEECSRMMKDFFKELREEGKRKKAEKTEEIKEDSHAGN